ncbi:synaptic plasticity regulator PANTS isoform X3 [Struthio camelus]|uniref:synaptic plasticity regulator PANTS isoform X3 n=1 Tax=Struthio camelus TaxID=8801 RepID=UPI003603C354
MAGGGAWRPPRSCEDYWAEWKHCRGLRHAFHHYYAHGELPSCGQWRADYGTCRAWERGAGAAAQELFSPTEVQAKRSRASACMIQPLFLNKDFFPDLLVLHTVGTRHHLRPATRENKSKLGLLLASAGGS